jgi:hypothetical protein
MRAEKMTDEFINKLSYKNKNVKLKLRHDLDSNQESGDFVFATLVDVIDIAN